MAKADVNKFIDDNKNSLIIAAAIIVLAAVFMFFRGRQQQRDFRLQQIDTQMDVWEEWRPQQNTGTGKGSGKIL